MKRTQRTKQAVRGTAAPQVILASRRLIDADGHAVNAAEANRKEPFRVRLWKSAGVIRHGMFGEKCRELGRSSALRRVSFGRPYNQTEGKLKVHWKSDLPIVLGGRESRPHGEGAREPSKPTQETDAGSRPDWSLPTRVWVIARRSRATGAGLRKREGSGSPVRENRTPGSEAGAAGNCRSYAPYGH